MLEIVILVFLCKGNHKRAQLRGKSGGGAIAYTLGLWLGLEIIGVILAFMLFFSDFYIYGNTFLLYLFGLGFAAIGGVISYFISKSGEAEYSELDSHSLITPCTLRIIRDASQIRSSTRIYFYLNGEVLDALENDSMLIANAAISHNTLTSRFEDEQHLTDVYRFIASPGGIMDIHCSAGKFLQPQKKAVRKSPERDW